jgi:hypothetical protein
MEGGRPSVRALSNLACDCVACERCHVDRLCGLLLFRLLPPFFCRHTVLAVARLAPWANANENESAASLETTASPLIETIHA